MATMTAASLADVTVPKFAWIEEPELEPYLTDDAWVAEQKADGVRCLVKVKDGKARFVAYDGRDYTFAAATQHFQRLAQQFESVEHELALDGELLLTGELWLFDLVWFGGESWDGQPFASRRRGLELLADHYGWHEGQVRILPQARTTDEKRALWKAVCDGGQEGIVLKRTDGLYRTDRKGRCTSVLKCKQLHTVDVVIMARNTGGPTSTNAEFGVWRDGRLVKIGACSMIGKPDLQPGDVGEVCFLYVPDLSKASLYQPRLLRARPDKPAAECGWEQLIGTESSRQIIESINTGDREAAEKETPMTPSTTITDSVRIVAPAKARPLLKRIGFVLTDGGVDVGFDDVENVRSEVEAQMALTGSMAERAALHRFLEAIDLACGRPAPLDVQAVVAEVAMADDDELLEVDADVPTGEVLVEQAEVTPATTARRPVLMVADGRKYRYGTMASAEEWAVRLLNEGKAEFITVTDEPAGRVLTFRKAS